MALSNQLMQIISTTLTQDSKLIGNDTYKDIEKILEFYRNGEDNIPKEFTYKLALAEKLCELRLNGHGKDVTLDSIKTTEKFVTLAEYIYKLETTTLPDRTIQEYIQQIKRHKKIAVTINDFDKLKTFVDNYAENNYDSIHDALEDFENVITNLYSVYSTEKRTENVASVSSLDLWHDDYDSAIDQIEKNYSGLNHVSTGYPALDKKLNGGFEPGRVYIFAGHSGDGKSTLMVNMIKNNLKRKLQSENKEEYDIHVYVTMENLIDESLLRLYCCIEGLKKEEVIKNWHIHKDKIKPVIKKYQEDSKCILLMVYYPATTVSAADIIHYVEEIRDRFAGVGKIKSLWIDYLDLMKSGKVFDMHRLELGQITIDLKVMAILLGVPVITITQTNKAGKTDEKLCITMIGDSMKKVEHSDFVAILRNIPVEEEVDENQVSNSVKPEKEHEGNLIIFIAKNRNGPKDCRINLISKFSRFEIRSRTGEETTGATWISNTSATEDAIGEEFQIPL